MKGIASMIGAFLGRVRKSMDQAACRHDFKDAHSLTRMFLRCHKCGKETPGWDMAGMKPPTPRFTGDSDRHRIGRVK